jgi:hypothetical protein
MRGSYHVVSRNDERLGRLAQIGIDSNEHESFTIGPREKPGILGDRPSGPVCGTGCRFDLHLDLMPRGVSLYSEDVRSI